MIRAGADEHWVNPSRPIDQTLLCEPLSLGQSRLLVGTSPVPMMVADVDDGGFSVLAVDPLLRRLISGARHPAGCGRIVVDHRNVLVARGPRHRLGQVAPRPVIVVNASEDGTVPRAATDALHAALQAPFEILWSPGDHVHPKRPESIAYISELLFERISWPGSEVTVQ